jgi:electron transfer flavoprotein beta subunit
MLKIVAAVQMVPDLVEELSINEQGNGLDQTYLRWVLNEFDDHAVEQAILLKEGGGGHVTVVIPDFEGAEDALYTAAAKGADRLIRLTGDFEGGVNSHALARMFKPVLEELKPDLVLTGIAAHHALDGLAGPLLAELLGMPFVGSVSRVTAGPGKVTVLKDYPGGLKAEIEVALPAVIGIQSAEKPPRYVPIAKVRQAMKTSQVEDLEAETVDPGGGMAVIRMYQPQAAGRAEMLEGDVDEVAARLAEILKEQDLLG